MKAVRLHATNDLRIDDVAVPEPSEHQVLLKVARASVCNGSDAAVYTGRRNRGIAYPWMRLPWTMGHECAGHIVGVGAGVSGFEVGDRVTSFAYGNAFAEYQVAAAAKVFPVPDGMSYDQATFIEPLFTTFSHIHHVQPGDAVVVCGAGPSGNLLMQESLAVGAGRVCVLDLYPLRLQIAGDMGAEPALCASSKDLEGRVREQFGEADVFIDATGHDVYDLGIRLLKEGGRLVMYGVPDSGVHYDGTRAYFKGIAFCKADKSDWPRTVRAALEHVEQGRIDLGAFTTHHFLLEDAPKAIQMALSVPEKVLGLVIDVQ